MDSEKRLPQTFLRGLEADLRALCADARRRNPEVKEAAERVILALKEADTPQTEANAADQAASAFCSACETPDLTAGSSTVALQAKVALRAVSCIHKLLSHRALSTDRLPEVLNALQRLSSPCVDDNLTLKVLQGLLSLLTVRSYSKSLSEDDLSRAFSMLFTLKTSRSSSSGNPATNAFTAISQMSGGNESGVIEQTAKAAFRQVSSDLFASAAEAAVRTAVERQAPSGEFIPLAMFPTEAQAAFSLFMDLCNAAAGDELEWLTHKLNPEALQMSGLNLALALEVIDDGLSGNIALFAGQPVFSEVLSARLCPVIHKLLRTTKDKASLKSLLGLVVTIVRNYWRNLKPDSETLLYALAKMSNPSNAGELHQGGWGVVYAVESLRCIFRPAPKDPMPIVDFVRAFDLGEDSNRSVLGVVNAACDAMESFDTAKAELLPPTPVNGTMKPFANIVMNTTEFLVAIGAGIYIDIAKASEEAIEKGLKEVARTLLPAATTERAVISIGKLLGDLFSKRPPGGSQIKDDAMETALGALAQTLARVAIVSDTCDLDSIRERSITTLSNVCASSIQEGARGVNQKANSGERVAILYEALFQVVSECRASLGRSWVPVVEALEQMDGLIVRIESRGDAEAAQFSSVISPLKLKLDAVVKSTTELPWDACHDMISAFVQCSRQSIAQLSKRVALDEMSKGEGNSEIRVFGISSAETAILKAFEGRGSRSDAIPSTLWQLLTGHLTSICTDSGLYSLRSFALRSLTRIACGAVQSGTPPIIDHEKIITPFLDLFTSSHTDVRSGALSSVYSILETQGERLTGEAAWQAVLQILGRAASTTYSKASVKDGDRLSEGVDDRNGGPGVEMVTDGFKVVQMIAGDFLSSLTRSCLPRWVEVVGLYCRQDEDVNVALTAIGLLWRTADFLAKSHEIGQQDALWVDLFHNLKGVSMDERPEIRNCAVKTLTGALCAHSFRLSAIAWSGCAEKSLLPLLEDVMQGGVQGDETGNVNKPRGELQLLLHHSRDTPRKQWNETRVLALAGVAKVLRTAMPRLAVLQDNRSRPLFLMLTDGGANGLWRKMLRAAGVAASSRDEEVAVAGVSALLELLSAAGFVVGDQERDDDGERSNFGSSASAPASLGSINGTSSTSWISGVIGGSSAAQENEVERNEESSVRGADTSSTIVLWEAVWSALAEAIGGSEVLDGEGGAVDGATGEVKIVDEKALQMLASGLIEARRKLGRKFTSGSSRMLVHVLMFLALGRRSAIDKGDISGMSSTELTDVQKTTMDGLEDVSFGEDEESWSGLVSGLLSIVRRGDPGVKRRALGIISRLYSEGKMGISVKRKVLPSIVELLGSIMLSRDANIGHRSGVRRNEEEQDELWEVATEVLMTGMKCGCDGEGGAEEEEIWQEFARITEKFVFRERRRGARLEEKLDAGERDRREDYDIKLTECIEYGIGAMGAKGSLTARGRLVMILWRGAEEGDSGGRRRLVRGCQRKLFQLADFSSSANGGGGIGKECGKYVVDTCGRVLGRFLADGQRAGRCPLPAGRRAEAVFMLQQLQRLQGGKVISKEQFGALYSRLCECVESGDEAVRHLARQLLAA